MALKLQDKLKALDQLSQNINKAAKKVVMGNCSDDALKKMLQVDFIPTPSIRVNRILGGGWPKGKFTIVSGKHDSGKTYILLETIAEQQKKDPDFVAGWLETEHSISNKDLDLFGIDRNRFYFLPFSASDGGAETVIDRVFAALSCGIDMFVINSLKSLVPSDELNGSMEKQSIGLQARMNSKFVRKLKPILADTNTAFIAIQHLSTEIGKLYGSPYVLSGGLEIKYGADIITEFTKLSISDADPILKTDGVKIKVAVTKNHVVTDKNPYVSCEYYGMYGQGTERYVELIDLAVEQGIFVKKGAFYRIPDEKGDAQVIDGQKMQWQGRTALRQYLIDNQDFYKDIVSKISTTDIEADSLSEEEIAKAKEENEKAEKEAQKILDEMQK